MGPIAERARRTVRAEGFSLREFIDTAAFGGVLLIVSALAALIWANSPWGDAYEALWSSELTLGAVQINFTDTLRHWVNDGLMAIFFFVVGLEIKREILVGELASPRRAALPAIAALGGVIVPATIYALLNRDTIGSAGWGIPMATDIAFALGVLALLGDRVPIGLKVFLTALAIVDDLAAVLVIALFYTGEVQWQPLGTAMALLVLLVAANRFGVRRPTFYAVIGIALWVAVYESGIHATIAGVLLAMTIPANTRINTAAFLEQGRRLLDTFDRAGDADYPSESILTNGARQEALAELEDAVEAAGAPLQRMEHVLHPWVSYAIVPLFALANAGVRLDGELASALNNHVTLGVVLGLVLGKQIGVTAASWLAVRSGLTDLPDGVTWRQIYGAGWLAGIGFTMSLFVADLAFGDREGGELLTAAKLGIIIASVVAGLAGWAILSRGSPVKHESPKDAP